jgi:HlyD family secretion protein
MNIICPQFYTDLTIVYLIPEGTIINAGDTVCILEASEIKSSYETALMDLEISKLEYTKSVESLKLQFLLLESQVRTIDASARIASLDSIQSSYVSESQQKIIRLEIQKAEIEKEKLQNKLKFLKEINESELKKLKLKIDQAQNKANSEKQSLDKMVMTSGTGGIVEYAINRATNKKMAEGDITWTGQAIVSIPDISGYRARLVVNESNYKRIAQGQKVLMQVDAIPGSKIAGKIIRKSAGGKPITRNSEVKIYDIYASVDSIDSKFQPGLSLTGTVLIEELKDTLVIPLSALFDQDSIKYVYLKRGKKFKKQTVYTKTHSSTMAVIDSGLSENDIISVIKPLKFVND